MNINSLSAEQQAAFNSLLTQYNTQSNSSLTAEEYQDSIILGLINAEVQRRYQIQLALIGAEAMAAPYEQRVTLIEINSAINAKTDEERDTLLPQIQALLS